MAIAASTCLSLREIENELRDVTEWYQLGVQLELTLDTLRTIESNYPHDAKRCKIEVLDWWLRNAPETSWEKLAQALEAMGGYASLTEELRKKIFPIANENETTETPQNGESVIERNGVNGGIYSKVQAEPPLAEHLQGMDIDKDELIVQTHDIRGRFLVLITQVRRCLQSKGVTVREFVGFLKQVPGYARKSLFDLKFSNLYEAPDLIAVFESVGEYCSWFNHSLLNLIIEAYCEDNKAIKKAHQEYCLHLQKYCKYRVRKFPFKNGFGQGGKRDKRVIMKVDRKWEEIRIEQLEEVVFDVACILKVSRHALHLCCVDKGCVQLTVVVPSCIQEEVFPLTPEQEADVRKIGVIDLKCGSYHFSCQIAKMVAKQKDEREQQIPSIPEADTQQSSMFTKRPLLIPKINIQDYDAPFADDHRHCSLEEQANRDLGVCMSYDIFTDGPRPRRTSSTNKLKRQEESISEEEYDAITPTSSSSSSSSADGHGRHSPKEQADLVAPLIGRGKFSQSSSTTRRMLVITRSDADSAVSMSFDHDECESEILHRSSCSITSSGLFSLNMSTTEGAVDVNIDRDAGETFVNSVQYECTYIIMEDYPPGDKEVVFKAGDRIVQVGNTYVRDKGPEDFAELLHHEATRGTTIKIVPRVEHTPPPSAFLTVKPTLHGRKKHLEEGERQSQLLDSMTIMKISNLLTMKSSGTKRTVTIPRTEGGYGFKMIGGNAVGLFISEVHPSLKDVIPGDQILQVNGQDTSHMTHFEATDLLQSSERVTLVVTENNARFKTLWDKFEFDSFFIRSCLDHTSADPRDMKLRQGTLMRVVNTILYGGIFWLAWTVDESTGLDSELRRIPSPAKIKKIHGKDAYERVAAPRLKEDTSARVLVA